MIKRNHSNHLRVTTHAIERFAQRVFQQESPDAWHRMELISQINSLSNTFGKGLSHYSVYLPLYPRAYAIIRDHIVVTIIIDMKGMFKHNYKKAIQNIGKHSRPRKIKYFDGIAA